MRNIGCTLCHLAFKTLVAGLKETFSSRWDEKSLFPIIRSFPYSPLVACVQKHKPKTMQDKLLKCVNNRPLKHLTFFQ